MYTIYSKEQCPRCVVAKTVAAKKGVEFEVKMAGVDFDVEYLRQLGVQQFPYIERDGAKIGQLGSLEDLMKEVFQ